MKSPRETNRLRTWRQQLCIEWWIDARVMCFHIQWTSNVNSPHYGWWCWHCLIIVWWHFSIRLKSELFLANPLLPRLLVAAGPLFSLCASCMHDGAIFLQRVVIKVWHSLSFEDRQAVIFALDFDQWQFAITGKVPQHYGGSVAVGMSSLDTGRMEILKGTFFDPIRVCPIGPTWRVYFVLSFRGYQRFYQWLQPSYPPLMSLLHAILELLSYLSWLSGGNTASQAPRTVGIYGPRFRNYRLYCHETWQKWSRDVNSEA